MSRTMIIDDDEDLSRIIATSLKVGGHEPILVSDPSHALEMAERLRPEAIILDVVMPQVSGWEVLALLRTSKITGSTPILMLSTDGNSKSRTRGIREGADDFLQKPFDPEELLARLDALLARTQASSSSLQGRLRDHPLTDVLQSLQHRNSRGILEVQARGLSGRIEIHGDRITHSRVNRLTGKEAFLTILEETEGTFSFTPTAEDSVSQESSARTSENSSEEGGSSSWSIPGLLLEAAWIEDELAARKPFLPPETASLGLVKPPTNTPDDLPDLPLPEILERFQQTKPLTLHDLLQSAIASPRRVQLAVAWLSEQNLVLSGPPTTFGTASTPSEASKAAKIPVETARTEDEVEANESPLLDLFQVATLKGFSLQPLCIGLYVTPGAWPSFARILDSIPSDLPGAVRTEEIDQLLHRQKGFLSLATTGGSLMFLVRCFQNVPTVPPSSTGIWGALAVWGNTELEDQHRQDIAKLEGFLPADAGRLLLFDSSLSKRDWPRWSHGSTPKNLRDLLRLLAEAWA